MWTGHVFFYEENSRKVEQPVSFGTPSRGTYQRSRRNSVINLGLRKGLVHYRTGQDSSEDTKQFWHGTRRGGGKRARPLPAGSSGSSGSAGWSGDAWDPATAYLLTSVVDTTYTRFETEVPRTAVVNMFGVSGSTSVSMVGAVQADPSQPTLRVEALSPGQLFN